MPSVCASQIKNFLKTENRYLKKSGLLELSQYAYSEKSGEGGENTLPKKTVFLTLSLQSLQNETTFILKMSGIKIQKFFS